MRQFRVQWLVATGLMFLLAISVVVTAQHKAEFVDNLDSVQAAPENHRVLFENAFVRVLEVRIDPGKMEPFHIHRWPGFFIYSNGGPVAAQRYYATDGTVVDLPRRSMAENRVAWSQPEGRPAIENTDSIPLETIRVEMKTLP